jgi:hypothetical protein
MSTTNNAPGLQGLLTTLEPYLGADARKQCQALKSIMDLFPGQTIGEVEKQVRALLQANRNTPVALADRARAFTDGSATETADKFLKDLNSLKTTEFKAFGEALNLELSGTKKEMVEAVQKWVESGGRVAPMTAKERAKREAERFAGDLPGRMTRIDQAAADEIIRKAEEASRELSKDAFAAFGELLGIPVSGTKPSMLRQIKDFVNRAAVSHAQTQF